MPKNPVVYDKSAWAHLICEHRRYLLERVVAAYPHLEKTQFTKLNMLRKQISGMPTGG